MRTPARNFLAAAAAAALLPATMAATVSPAQKANVSTPRTAAPTRHLVVLLQET